MNKNYQPNYKIATWQFQVCNFYSRTLRKTTDRKLTNYSNKLLASVVINLHHENRTDSPYTDIRPNWSRFEINSKKKVLSDLHVGRYSGLLSCYEDQRAG